MKIPMLIEKLRFSDWLLIKNTDVMQMSGYLRECCEFEQSQNGGRHPEIISMVVLVEVQSSVLIINPGKLHREYPARMSLLNAWQS